ncbi:MAG TPA: bifunctional nuclease family protein [Candidatus Limnocylindrales bacterium]|jgi:bifunctional DNase/RNase|nr:bifunctional nuclease family protein [Candidatus Limnocylindrales bacterium]
MYLEMKVKGLTLDPLTNMPIVILRDLEDKKALPIWVGLFEANAIALELEKISTPRPMTHDLMKDIIEGLNATVNKIVVNDLKNNTFYATIQLTTNGNKIVIDSRPSDAIALALRVGAPIYVAREVIEKAKSIDMNQESEDTEKLKEWLENLKPEDFSKYQM